MKPKAPTVIALAVFAFLVAVLGGYMAFTKYSRRSNQMRESSKVRGIHQNRKFSTAELAALTQPSIQTSPSSTQSAATQPQSPATQPNSQITSAISSWDSAP